MTTVSPTQTQAGLPDGGTNRRRLWCLAAFFGTMVLGLASRRFPMLLPAALGKYPGDVLWATMVYFGWAALLPKQPTYRAVLYALATAYGIEVLKLYQAPWIVSVRHSTLGHLIFGHVFSWENLLAYALGIALGVGVDFAVVRLFRQADQKRAVSR